MENALTLAKTVGEELAELQREFLEFAQGKTDFQIEKFSVAAEGALPSHQYRHALKQVEVGLYQVKLWALDAETLRRKVARIEKDRNVIRHHDESDNDIFIMRGQTELDALEVKITGRLREVATYRRICDHLQRVYGPFTAEQYQADEVEYYRQRLARQALSHSHPAGAGNIESIQHAGAPVILPGSRNRFELPLDSPKALHMIARGEAVRELRELGDLCVRKAGRSEFSHEGHEVSQKGIK